LAHALRAAGGLSVGRNMLVALARVAPQHQYQITIPGETDCEEVGYEDICDSFPDCQKVVYAHTSPWRRLWYEAREVRRLVMAFRPDVLLGLGNRGIICPPCPQAVMLQDAHYFYPFKHYGKITLYWRLKYHYDFMHLRRVIRQTQLVLCQTPVAQRRIRDFYGYDGRMLIVPNTISQFLGRQEDPSLPVPLRPYAQKMRLFCLSNFYGHKNLEMLPGLFRRYARELRDVVVVLTLPEQNKDARHFLRAIRQRDVAEHFVNVGPLPQMELAGYYRHCQALFLPTLMESFSGTYVEAMHFGVPVLTSDLDFARAVCGEAALYFDPWRPETIKDAIVRLRKTPGLAEELVAKGKAHLSGASRSWDEIASEVMASLLEIAEKQ
jgi:glycosyltransferase involved in cell wall biosynthesis